MMTLALFTILAGTVLAMSTGLARRRWAGTVHAHRGLAPLSRPNVRGLRNLAGFALAALLALPLACWASGAQAGCSGSGSTWNCTAGSTSSDISSALSAAPDGATITFAPGSYSWNSFVSFNNSKGASLICSSPGACNVNASGTVLGMNGNLSGTNNHLYRVSGFNFTGQGMIVWFYGPGTMQQVRIDHNNFNITGAGNTAVYFGENYTLGHFYGVVDHNTFSSSSSFAALQYIGIADPNPPASPFGKGNNLFFEDNTITIATMTDSGTGCIDGWGGDAIVYRHNTSTNCLVTSHGAPHAGGPANFELYNNRIIVNAGTDPAYWDCSRCFHHQGSGEFIAFNNQFTAYSGKSADAIAMMNYRDYGDLSSSNGVPLCNGTQTGQSKMDGVPIVDGNRSPSGTYLGYPCWHQPGRDFAGNLKPMYAWNNTWSDTGGQVRLNYEYGVGGSPDYSANHSVANRDYYNAVSASAQTSPSSPFNGTAGMGFGTLANRPATCTPGSETGGGVAYFATDQGPQGTLYRCSATNTWAVHYQPYTYPHPLVNGGNSAPVITSPSAASDKAGQPFSYVITATNNPSSFNASGLPAGLSINTVTGVIAGTPAAAGTSNIALSATNAAGTGTAALTLTVSPSANAPAITSPLTASGAAGTPFSYTITATNNPTSFNASGLPPGLSVNKATGVISGTPATAGSYSFTVSASNAAGTGSAILSCKINGTASAPVITSAPAASGTAGTWFSYQIAATNSPASFNAWGLPAGLSINTTTGVISGTPAAAGTSNVTLGATNASGTGYATLVLTVQANQIAAAASLFSGIASPPIVPQDDANPVELGVKFYAARAGKITGVRFYKNPNDTGTHTAHLWDSAGHLLASATFTSESGSGWQQVNFAAPVAIGAYTTYVASYHSNGNYSETDGFFNNAYSNGGLTAPSSGASGGNSVYAYGSAPSFPSATWNAANYWVDVVFQ